MKTIQSKTIVFITGAFVSHSGWEPWIKYFESRGYKCIAPPWPGKEGSAKELRSGSHNDDIASIRLPAVIEAYTNIIQSLPEKPILIGHSFGGLLTQILVNRDLAAAGIAIHSVPPPGVVSLEFSFYKATWGPLGFLSSPNKPFLMSFPQWQYAFTNGMPLEEQKKAYEENVIPESKRAARGALGPAGFVNFKKPHAPLLFLAGSTDNIIPAKLNRRNYKRYKKNNGSVTDFKEIEGHNHFVVGLPTWQKDADIILEWLNAN